MPDLRFLPDLDALVAPLPGDAPGGDKGVYNSAVKDQVKRLRNPENEDDPPDWAGVLKVCLPVLETQAKDLRVAQHVVEAVARRAEADRAKRGAGVVDAFAALREGLHLLRRLTADGWDFILPAFDPDDPDPEARNGPYDWLGNDNAGAALPQFVRLTPLAVAAGGALSQHAWEASTSKPEARAKLEQVANAADPARLAAVRDELEACQAEVAGVRDFLSDKLGPDAPGLGGLKNALDDAHELAVMLLARLSGGAADEPQAEGAGGVDEPAAGDVAGPKARSGPAAAPATRADAYAQLRQAADLLLKLEPHSPVPYLVRRAVELGGLPFPDMIKSFVRDDAILTELRRELNIPAAPAE